jgi:metal-responsive CopG/Arc/MetJ family transcriptional regulator
MTSVVKVTVSVPSTLMARIEERRRETGGNRSEVVTDLLWRGWRQLEDEQREESYRAAYHAHPPTEEESGWSDAAADELLAGKGAVRTQPDPGPGSDRRAAS